MDTRREILQQVAAGDLTPEEAARRLEELERGAEHLDEPDPGRSDEPTDTVRSVRVVGDFRTVRITGDSSVGGAVAEGPHTAHRDGETLVIDGRDQDPDGGFTFRRDRSIVIGLDMGRRPKPLVVRMNPSLALEVRVDAGAASIEGVRGPIKGDVDAGSLKIRGFASPIDLTVDAGSVLAQGLLTTGDSRIRCDAGSVKVLLERGSSVRVKAQADVGSVRLGRHAQRGMRIGGGPTEAVFGNGDGILLIEGGIGRVVVDEA